MARCCGGMSLLVQGLQSDDPTACAFIQGCGTILSKELAAGEELLVDGESLLGFSDSVAVDVKFTGNCKTICYGGEGLFNTQLKGPGLVLLQSMPIEKLRKLFPKQKEKKSTTADIEA